jgi:DNA gyrase subunit B
VVNALAAKVVAEVDKDGATHRLSFVEQVPGRIDAKGDFKPGSTLEVVKKIPPKRSGTRVRFWPDLEIFDPGLSIEYELVRDHCAQVCFLVPGLKVRLVDKRGSTPREPEEFVPRAASPTWSRPCPSARRSPRSSPCTAPAPSRRRSPSRGA